MPQSAQLSDGYYWYEVNDFQGICWVRGGYVHFFGEPSQKIGNEYLEEYVTFGDKIDR